MTIPKSKLAALLLIGICLGIVLAATPRRLPNFWGWLLGGVSAGFAIWTIVAVMRSWRSAKGRDAD